MSTPYPTIKHFYPSIPAPSKQPTPSKRSSPPHLPPSTTALASSPPPHDATLIPPTQYTPPQAYHPVLLSTLSPGPRLAIFIGRVTNIYDLPTESKMPSAAKGCLKLLAKDDTATILIKLWYASPTTYDLRLGTLLTVWTTHIHSTSTLSTAGTAALPVAPIMTSIFPERDSGCHVQVHDEEGRMSVCCRRPLGDGNARNEIMNLDTYINHNGVEKPDARLLVCVVAVGEPVSVMTTASPPTTFLTLTLTLTCPPTTISLSLPPPLFSSAKTFLPNQTILLITSPRLRSNRLTLTSRSHVEIDPNIPEAIALRRTVQRGNTTTNTVFPEEVAEMHIQRLKDSGTKLQFTFASLCGFISDADADANLCPSPTPSSSPLSSPLITGFLPLLLTRINLTSLTSRHRLFSMPCCNMPVYANTLQGICGQCGKIMGLRINPDVVGGMADETGGFSISSSSASSKRHSPLLWTDLAWMQLLGRTQGELAEFVREDVSARQRRENAKVVRYLEQRLEWMRVVLLVGWMGGVMGGRVGVLGVVA